jgi:serine protease Do
VTSLKDFERVSSGLKKGENVLILIDRRGSAVFLSAKV